MTAGAQGLGAAEAAALAAAIAQVLADEAAAAAPDPLPAAYRSRWARGGRAAGVTPPPPLAGDGLDRRGAAGG